MNSKWLSALRHHYTASPRKVFKQFRLGAMLFFLGLVTIYIAHQLWQPSLEQEGVTLAGLSLTALGFVTAMLAQIRLLIGRFVLFFSKR